MTEDTKVQKIQALLAKAESTDSSEEAEALFAKAEELMTKWAIDDALLRATGKLAPEDFISERVSLVKSYFMSNIRLLQEVAQANDCRIVMMKPYRGTPGYGTVAGFRSDVDNTMMLFTSLLLQVTREVKHAKQDPTDGSSRHIFRRTFRDSFAYRIGERLREARRRVVQEETARRGDDDGPGTELVLRDKSDLVEQKYHEMFPGLRSSHSRTREWSSDGSSKGRAAANRADVGNRRVGNNRKELS